MSDGGVVLWDFEGTLGEGPWRGSWSRCLWEVIAQNAPEMDVKLDSVRAFRREFPWHAADGAHPELCEPEAW
jgi:hypothetical protein